MALRESLSVGPCIDDGALAAFIDGDLAPGDADRVRWHLDGCQECHQLAAGFARTFLEPSPFDSGGDGTQTAIVARMQAQGRSFLAPGSRIGRYTVREALGAGGMGVVYLADEPDLSRQVALKVPTSSDPAVVNGLLREARTMGALEHPNLVPVHWLGMDANGSPLLAMKRIEGATWRDLLDDEAHPAWTPLLHGHDDRLRANVEILSQICRALAFAHDRGVIHRDLKPDNVMIGRFGEVYLLDWGVALRMADRADEAQGVVGTPGYLAPEMAMGDPMMIDERTDVFLLGATLHHVLTGRAPHAASNAMVAIGKALAGTIPELPDSVSPDLARLVRASLARERDDRPPSADAFRLALTQFFVARDAEIVARDAREATRRARELVTEEGPASANAFRFLIEARFGFAAALRLLPHDTTLHAELQASITRLVERDVAVRSPTTARALLQDLTAPDADLVERVSALEEEMRREQDDARAHAHTTREADTSKIVNPLSRMLLVMAAIGAITGPIAAYQTVRSGAAFPVAEALVFDGAAAVALALAFALTRRALLATAATRRIAGAYGIACLGVLASDAATFALGRSTSEAAVHSLLLATFVTAMTAVTVVRLLWIAVPILAASVAVAFIWPRFAPLCAAVSIVAIAFLYPYGFRAQTRRAHE